MADNEIRIVVKGKDEATPVLEGIADAVGGLGDNATIAAGKPGGGGVAGLGAALAGPAAAGAAVVGAAVLGVGGAALDMALDFDQANRSIQTQLGLTAEEAAALEPAIKEVFIAGMTGSANESALAIAETRRQLKGLADEDLANATNQSLMLSQAMGTDQAQVLNSVNTLMTQFGLDSQQAFDFVAAGYQNGLNASGDFLDSIGEYSNQFAGNGFAAEQFFSAMQTGMQGGMLGTDKASDAFKEFGIRVMAVGDDIFGPEGALRGQMTDEAIAEMVEGLENGTLSIEDAFNTVMPVLKGMDNEVQRNSLGVALFGTQWEDLGASAMLGMDLAATSMDDLSGSTDSLGEQFGGLGADFESTKRELMAALLPLGEELVTLAKEYMPAIKEGAAVLAVWLGENLPKAIDQLMVWWTDFNEGIGVVKEGFDSVVTAIQPALELIASFGQGLASIGDKLPDWMTPGSPTPLELGLIGIDQALAGVAGTLPDLEAGLSLGAPLLPDVGSLGMAAGGGGSIAGGALPSIVINVAGSVTSEGDLVERVRLGLSEFYRRNGYAITE